MAEPTITESARESELPPGSVMPRGAVVDWGRDMDVLDPGYVADPYGIWRHLREQHPVAFGERRGRSWLVTRREEILEVVGDPERFSSRAVMVIPFPGEPEDSGVLPHGFPPITADPPHHGWTRRLLQPWIAGPAVGRLEPSVREESRRLAASVPTDGVFDAADGFARLVPVHAVARVLGIERAVGDAFTGWVRDVLEHGDDRSRRRRGLEGLLTYFWEEMGRRRGREEEPPADLVQALVQHQRDGAPLDPWLVLGVLGLVVLAGVDTTWSALASALWHLAGHPEQAEVLRAEPDRLSGAVEELLRAYAPVTMARVVVADTELRGCPMRAGDRVLLGFPAACRDPEAHDDPDRVDLDRPPGRNLAFGSGIHRCLGAALARMELRVALETWLTELPPFRLAPGSEIRWSGGQVRGPTTVPVVFDRPPTRLRCRAETVDVPEVASGAGPAGGS